VICKICGKEYKRIGGHVRQSHKMTPKEYYDKYLKKPGEGICPVTGKPTTFMNIQDGYCRYASEGAVARDPVVKEKRRQTCLKKYGVEHPTQALEVKEKTKQTCLKKYGVINIAQLEGVQEKRKQTCLKKYGVEYSSQAPEVKEKVRQTCLKKYGVEYSSQAPEVKEKAIQTCLKKYGVINPSQVPEFKKKIQQTCLKHYGVKNPTQSPIVRTKTKQTILKRYGVEYPLQSEEIKTKVKKTCLEKYGVEHHLQNKEILEKRKQACLEKYGVESITQLEEVKEKKRQTYLKHYGVENPSQSEEVKQKKKETCLRHYGVESPSQSEEVKEKKRQTYLKHYGVENPLQTEEAKAKIREKCMKRMITKLDKILKELNLELLDKEYQNASYKHRWKCLKCGHEFIQAWTVIQQGYLCPKCQPRTKSKQEDELAEFVESLGINIIRHNRTLIKPLELDIVLPDYKIAIEYNGLYWHNENFIGETYHLEKTEVCEKIGYRLIHIFEDEWILKQDIVKSRLKHILGKTEDLTHIGARECTIKEISSKEKNQFLEHFHIQGPDASKVKLGAFYEEELIAVMTFSHGSLAKGVKHQSSLVWELNRFCTHSDFVISGIASKLLEYFKKNYDWHKIFSYADRRWSDGNLYEKLGFELEHVTQPNYWYIRDFQRTHRFALRKRPDEPKDIPEYILRLQEGYIRVWDCGNLKFRLINEKYAAA